MTASPKITSTLRSRPLFAGLSDSELQAIAARAVLKSFGRGELLKATLAADCMSLSAAGCTS
jgi:hypothetical protein